MGLPKTFGTMPEGMQEPDFEGLLRRLLEREGRSLAAHLWAAYGGIDGQPYAPEGFVKLTPRVKAKWRRVEEWIRQRASKGTVK